ncbi:MAG: phospho-N-acetylmuramoyl-pentapeptide-transferase, partial [Elusimicrobiota bacterium]
MLYYLAQLRELSTAFNIFQYITFRAGGAALTALGVCLLLGPGLIRALQAKKVGQMQRADGPQSHLAKQGTPTMGGALIFLAVV